MTKTRKIVFLLLVLLIIGFLSYQYLFQKENTPLTFEQRYKDKNTASKLELKAGQDYKVDNKKFKQGFYDITSLKGNVKVNNVFLDKGDKLLSMPFYYNNSISVKGEGKVLLSPAEFQEIPTQNGINILDNESGVFQVGKEIEAGNYTIQVFNKKNSAFYVFVNINNSDENSKDAKSFNIRNTSEKKVSIKEGDILKIFNWSKNKTDISIKLTKEGN
ncbi:MAG: hypothetical protein ACQET8_22460 [Bacillota bacterium]